MDSEPPLKAKRKSATKLKAFEVHEALPEQSESEWIKTREARDLKAHYLL